MKNSFQLEFNGKQHYEAVEIYGGENGFKNQQMRDKIKIKYCVDKEIPLLIIPYWNYRNIPMIIEEFIQQL